MFDRYAVAKLEQSVSQRVAKINDIDKLKEWRDQAAALEAYLRSRGLQRPMLGAQRRVEGRIGQLLGDPSDNKGGRGKTLSHAEGFSYELRHQFRVLALAFECCDDDEWRRPNRAS